MSSTRNSEPIRIGLATDEPIRVAGLASIFDQPAQQDQAQLVPVIGSLPELLALVSIEYIVVDLHSSPGGFETLEIVRQTRPDVRLIVIGPEGDDELVLSAIIAGARGYLGLSAGPEVVRKAIEVVTSGSIWAPRRLLSRLIDRLLKVPTHCASRCWSAAYSSGAAGSRTAPEGTLHTRDRFPIGHRAAHCEGLYRAAHAKDRRRQPHQAVRVGA